MPDSCPQYELLLAEPSESDPNLPELAPVTTATGIFDLCKGLIDNTEEHLMLGVGKPPVAQLHVIPYAARVPPASDTNLQLVSVNGYVCFESSMLPRLLSTFIINISHMNHDSSRHAYCDYSSW